MQRFDVLVASAGHHFELCGGGSGGNEDVGASGVGGEFFELDTIAKNAQDIELGNTSIGVELIIAYVATEGGTGC